MAERGLLTARRRDPALVGEGSTKFEIAEKLAIRVCTAKFHVWSVVRELGVADRPTDLVLLRYVGSVETHGAPR